MGVVSGSFQSPQVSGVVADPSGALIGECVVRVLGADGTLQKTTRTDKRGAFGISGLAIGTYTFPKTWRVSVELLNLLNRRDHDIDYAYESRITPTAQSAFTDIFHPVEPFQVRFWLRKTF
jgi:hypothetical protein